VALVVTSTPPSTATCGPGLCSQCSVTPPDHPSLSTVALQPCLLRLDCAPTSRPLLRTAASRQCLRLADPVLAPWTRLWPGRLGRPVVAVGLRSLELSKSPLRRHSACKLSPWVLILAGLPVCLCTQSSGPCQRSRWATRAVSHDFSGSLQLAWGLFHPRADHEVRLVSASSLLGALGCYPVTSGAPVVSRSASTFQRVCSPFSLSGALSDALPSEAFPSLAVELLVTDHPPLAVSSTRRLSVTHRSSLLAVLPVLCLSTHEAWVSPPLGRAPRCSGRGLKVLPCQPVRCSTHRFQWCRARGSLGLLLLSSPPVSRGGPCPALRPLQRLWALALWLLPAWLPEGCLACLAALGWSDPTPTPICSLLQRQRAHQCFRRPVAR
jgi:hypothetical protein